MGNNLKSKSVINMVHRIQNRNPGYSDLTTGNGTASFSFSNATTNPVTHGANALKLENEVVSESTQNESVEDVNHQYHEELLKNQQSEDIGDNSDIETEIPLSDEETNSTDDQSITNDLKEFGVDTDEPDLFSSEDQNNNVEDLLNSSENEDEDDLEIPAFLRRQKN